MSIPIEVKNGRVYDFGIQRISVEEQEELLKQSYIHKPTKEAIDNWELFEDLETGRILETKASLFMTTEVIGFCIKPDCKKKSIHTETVRAVSHFFCLRHLAESICLSRAMSYTGPILIQFTSRVPGTKQINQENFQNDNYLQFHNSSLQIGKHNPVTGKFIETNNMVDDNFIQYTFMVDSSVKINGEYYNGTILSSLRGKHVCQSIIDNHSCLSLASDRVAGVAPKGVANWFECIQGESRGKIMTLKKCYECAVNDAKNDRTKVTSPNGKSSAKFNCEEKIEELQREVAELKRIVRELQRAIPDATKKPFKPKPKKNKEFY